MTTQYLDCTQLLAQSGDGYSLGGSASDYVDAVQKGNTTKHIAVDLYSVGDQRPSFTYLTEWGLNGTPSLGAQLSGIIPVSIAGNVTLRDDFTISSGSPDWYLDNYGITVITTSAGAWEITTPTGTNGYTDHVSSSYTYELRAVGSVTSGSVDINVVWYNSGGSVLRTDTETISTTGTNYTYITANLGNAPTGAVYVSIGLDGTSSAGHTVTITELVLKNSTLTEFIWECFASFGTLEIATYDGQVLASKVMGRDTGSGNPALNGTQYQALAVVADTAGPFRLTMTQIGQSVDELYATFTYTTYPTVTVDDFGAAPTISNPDVTWTYSQADSYAQGAYRVKVYGSGTYGLSGFDPETNTDYVYDSGIVYGTNELQQVYGLLDGVTYKAYVQVATLINGSYHWSEWSSNAAFTPDLDVPTPALAATWSSVKQAVQLDLTLPVNLLDENAESVETDVNDYSVVAGSATIAQSTDQAKVGTNSIKVTNTGADESTVTISTLTGTNGAPVTVGTEYTATAYVYPGDSATEYGIAIRWYDSGGSGLSSSASATDTVTAAQWAKVTVTAAAPASAAYASVRLVADGVETSEVFYWDVVGIAATDSSTIYRSRAIATFERATSDGYVTVYESSGLDALDGSVTVFDYEAPRDGTVLTYRVRVTIVDVDSVITGAAVTDTVTPTSDGLWWWKSLDDPSLNRVVPVRNGLDVEMESDTGVFRPLDSPVGVVVSGVVHGQDGTYDVTVVGQTEFEAYVLPLLRVTGPLFINDPLDRGKRIKWVERSWEESYQGGNLVYSVTVTYVEV